MFSIFQSLYFKLIIAFVIVLAVGVGLASLLISRFTTNEFGFYLRSPLQVSDPGIYGSRISGGRPASGDKSATETENWGIGGIKKGGNERSFLPGRFALTAEEWRGLREAVVTGKEETKQFVESLNLGTEERQRLLEYIDANPMRGAPYGSGMRKAGEAMFSIPGRFALTLEEWRGLRRAVLLGPEDTRLFVESLSLGPEEKQSLMEYINRGMIRTMFPPPGMRNLLEKLGEAEEDFLEGVNRYLWLSAGIAFLIAIIISLLLARQILSPLKHLALASNGIAGGDFKSRVEIKTNDEIGKLGSAFNKMALTLQVEKERQKALLADVSHELRTPLSVLGGKLEAMLDDVIKPTPEQLASMHDEVLLLSRLVQDLQTLSLAEAGRLEMHFAQTNVSALVSRVVSSFKNLADTKNVSLILRSEKDSLSLNVDSDRISQVLRNLLSNALRYVPAGGRVEVAIGDNTSGDNAIFSVSDNGPGIPPEEMPHIFERFHRVDRSRSRATGGSGLGLTIAKQLVEAHKGTIWAESQLGKGSTFYFKIPKTT